MAARTLDRSPGPARATGGHTPRGTDSLRLRGGVWWMHPGWTGLWVTLPCLAITWLTPDNDYRLWWRTPKYFTSTHGLMTLSLLGAFVVGAILPSLARRRPGSQHMPMLVTSAQRQTLARAGRVFLVLTIIGYAAWMSVAVARGYGPQQLSSVLRLRQGALLGDRAQYFNTVPGITTLTQFGPVALICLLLHRRISGERHTLALTALAAATLARTFLNAERLALVEMAVPAVVLAAALLPRAEHKPRRTWLWTLFPLIAPVVLIIVFGAFEYTRSWNDTYSQHADSSFGLFVLHRIGGYYATASNNSAILIDHLARSMLLPCYTISFFWNFPIFGSFFDSRSTFLTGSGNWFEMLTTYGNPEFINQGGILPAVADYGFLGAHVWWGFIGLLLGLCYRTLRAGEPYGLVLYAVIYVGLLELGRIFYWGYGRAFPTLAGGIIVWMLLRRARHRDEQPERAIAGTH
jgi:hypothetical protein